MYCRHCGVKNEEEAKFCKDCGNQLKVLRTKPHKHTALLVTSLLLTLLVFIFVGYKIITIINDHKTSEEVTESDKSLQKTEEKLEKVTTNKNPEKKEPLQEKEKTQIIKESQSRVYTIFTESSLGSGFLFEEKGTVITNAHVVAGYNEVILRNVNGQKTTGKVIGISDLYDIALIQVDDYAGQPPLKIETDETDIGTEVIALGSPQGLENSASIGYLTGLDRSFASEFQYENVYQIDAQISPGSSGGPLLDANTGKVIGINSATLNADQSIGFSIPMYTMLELVQEWSESPMSSREVVNVFSFYDDYVYDPEASAKADSYYEDYEAYEENTDENEFYFDETTLTEFVLYFRDNYELALDYEDFYYIEDMLLFESTAYNEMEDYIAEISGQGMIFDFTSNEITGISIETDHAVVNTFETFDFMNAAGEWSVYERAKDYTVIIDEYGAYMITDILIYD
ncbi:MAG: trypsin-like peptidase domain-containing protein [Paenisporosarcina sp.]